MQLLQSDVFIAFGLLRIFTSDRRLSHLFRQIEIGFLNRDFSPHVFPESASLLQPLSEFLRLSSLEAA